MEMKEKCLMVAALGFLAACGGGGGGGAEPSTPQPANGNVTVLRVFADGSGIARATVSENASDSVVNVIGSNIESFRPSEGSIISAGGESPSTFDGIDYERSNEFGDFYTGITEINGASVNVLIFVSESQQVEAGFVAGGGSSAAYAGGDRVSNIPSGTYTYAGTNIVGNRDGSAVEVGEFSMNVDFNNRVASISGQTDRSAISGNNIPVDVGTGSFAGNNLTLTNKSNGQTFGATIDGSFHGNGATGVTGVYADRADIPTVAGVIAGTKQ